MAIERLFAGQEVVAGLELEVHEVRLGDEARLRGDRGAAGIDRDAAGPDRDPR